MSSIHSNSNHQQSSNINSMPMFVMFPDWLKFLLFQINFPFMRAHFKIYSTVIFGSVSKNECLWTNQLRNKFEWKIVISSLLFHWRDCYRFMGAMCLLLLKFSRTIIKNDISQEAGAFHISAHVEKWTIFPQKVNIGRLIEDCRSRENIKNSEMVAWIKIRIQKKSWYTAFVWY